MRILKIQSEEDYQWLKKYVSIWRIRSERNIPAYGEHQEMFKRLDDDFSKAEKVTDTPENPLVPSKKSNEPKAIVQSYCSKHKTYMAKRVPRTDCSVCWEAYKKLNPMKVIKKRNV